MLQVKGNQRFGRVGVGLVALAVAMGVAPMAAQERPATAVNKSAAPQATPQGPTLRLTMKEAETMAVETNLGLKQARLNSEIAAQNIVSARASFLPGLRANVSRSTSETQAQSVFESSANSFTNGSANYSGSVNQFLPWYGNNYSVSWSGKRSTTTQLGSTFNPTLGSTFQFAVNQPILRNFRTDSNRARLETAQLQQLSTDLQVQQQIVGKLGGGDRYLAGHVGVEFEIRQHLCGASRLSDLARVIDDVALLRGAFRVFHDRIHTTSIV